MSEQKMKLYRTAKTKVQVGNISAGTHVSVEYVYQEKSTGRYVFNIRTSLFGGIEENDVFEEHLEKFVF